MIRFLAKTILRTAVKKSTDGVVANDSSSRYKLIVVKWLSFGAGFAVASALLITAVSWYSHRPKQWDSSAIIGKFDHCSIDDAYKISVYYTLENTTNIDYEINDNSAIRLFHKNRQGVLDVMEVTWKESSGKGNKSPLLEYSKSIFLPAGRKTPYSITWNVSFQNDFSPNILKLNSMEQSKLVSDFLSRDKAWSFNGFVMYDENRKYEIDFPSGP